MQIFYRLFRNSQTQIRQRVNWRYWLIGCLLWAALLPNAQGEGSRDFTGYGGVRLFYSADVHQQLKVYANEGEFINFGTSHLGTTNPIDDRFKGLIYVYRPDGSLFQVYDGGNSNNPVGRIQNNTQESGGPTGGGSTNGTGYEPLVASVGSGESGIWTFVFKFEAPAMDQPFFPALDNGAAWNTNNQANNRRAILAWDITVSQNAAANAGGNQLTGRVYSNEYVSVTGNFGPQTSPTFYVLTRDGFQYQIDFDRADPFEFPVFSNSVGLIDGNLNPLNSSRIEPDVNRVSSLDNLVADQIYLYDPQERDVGAIITNKIFFSRPDPNMPNTATLVNVRETSPGILMAGAPFETWLFNAPGVDPGSIADLEFIGASELCTDNTTQVNAGGAFVFNSNRAGAAVLQLDTNNDGDFDDEVDVEIRDFIEAGRDTLFWDGTDGAGNLLTAVTGNLNFTVEIDLQRAEIHIMIDDVENIEGGIAFDLLNGPAAVDADLFFYDHRPAPRMNRIQNSAFFNVDLVSGLDGDGNLVPTDQSHNYADTDVDALQFERGFGDSLLLDYFNFIALAQPFSESLTIEIVENCGTPPDDFDEDGVPDVVDIDDDNDGILDRLEFCNPDGGFACLPGGVDPSGDEDNDGIQNFEDADDVAIGNACMDVNADGVCDNLPAVYDTDGDGVPDHRDVDSDNDGITDLCESGSEQTDVNGDGVIDGPNSDFGDNGFYVGIETDDTPTANPTYNRIDKDGDGVPDHDDLDTDNDGIYDLGEAAYFDLDANNDGRLDYESVNRWGLANVIDPDVTGNPVMKPIDFDNDGVEDFRDLDSDNDGINDVTEHVLILIQDPDGDGMIREGMPEVDENGVAIIDSLAGIILVISSDPIDFDNDGIPDFHDLDTDSDNILDAVEGFSGDFDPDFDGILGEGTPTVNEDGQVTSSGTTSTSDPNNQDGDELADFRDRDSDDDGIADINECVGTALCNDVDDDGTDDYREPNCTADNTPAITVVQNEMDVFCSDSTQLTYTITNSGFNAGIVTYTATLPNNTQITDTLVNNTAILTVANLDMVGGETMQVILTATENGCTTDPLDVLIDCEDFVCTPENSPTVFVSTNTNGTVCPGDDVVYTIQSTGFQEGEPDFFVTFPDGQEATGTLDGRESVITITATDTTFTGDGMFYLVGTNGCTSDTALVNIFVAKVNAVNDGFLATSGVPLLGADILQNDDSRDVDVTLVDLPNNGTASIDENGNLNYTSVEGYVGQDTLTYSICNMTCTTICDTAQVIIEVVPVDCDETNTPVLTVENTIAGPNCPDNTVDFTYSIANFVDGTILSLTNPAGELSNPDLDGMFTTEIGMGGTYTFIATNPNGCADTVMVAITAIETVTANDDSYSITNGETLTGVNVFDNDTNNGGTFTIVSDFENGTGAIDTDGNLTYTPNDGFVGMDTLTYEICDVECTAACDRATVIVTVDGCDETTTPVLTAMSSSTDPICPGDAFTLTWSTTNVIDGTTAILSGVGSIPLDGSLTLTLSNVSNYTFIATNPNGCADTVTVTLTVIETAIANDDNYTINTGETLTDVNIFDNDTNNGGTFTIVSDFENGTGSIDAEGNLTYMPNDGFVGMDTLTYEICDVECTESCDQAMVIVTVDGCDETTTPDLTITFVPDVTDPNAPVCPGTEVDYTFANTGGGENVVVTGTLPDGSTFEGTLADAGSYTVTSTGTATFIATAGECADTVTVTFNVIETAVANDDSYTISIGETLTGENVFDNDTNNGGTFTIISDFENGTGSIDADGNLTYTPNDGFVGMDMLTYEICDVECTESCDQATVTVTVEECTEETSPAIGELTITPDNILCPGDNVTFTVTNTGFSEGTITATLTLPNGEMRDFIVPTGTGGSATIENIQIPADLAGSGSIILTAENGCESEPASFTLIVPIVEAADDSYTTDMNTTLTGVNILSNDNPSMGTITILDDFDNGTATIDDNGDLTYVPNEDFVGMDTLTYQLCDVTCTEVCDMAQVIVDVMMVECNEETTPTVAAFTIVPDEKLCPGDEATLTITGGGFNEGNIGYVITLPDGNELTGILDENGMASVTLGNITLDVAGTALVVLTSEVNGCMSEAGSVSIVVAEITANDDAFTTMEDTPVSGDVTDNDDRDASTVTLLDEPMNGTVTLNEDGTFEYTPNEGFFGTDSFTYRICDAVCTEVCDEATVTITVEEVMDPCEDKMVVAVDDAGTINQGEVLAGVNVLDNDDFEAVTITTGAVTGGVAVIDENGNLTFTPADGFTGTATVSYEICDIECPDVCDQATVTITVVPNVDPCEDKVVDAVDDNFTGTFRGTLSENVITNDVVESGTTTLNKNVDNGTLTLNSDGSFTYTPNRDFYGEDTFTYTLCDVECPDVCDDATVTINVADPGCFIPNFITPNGDGDNDRFEIPCAVTDFTNNRLTIYNRWGDLIYETNSYQNTWDGTYEGEPVAAGTYFYVFQPDVNSEECDTGFVSIVR